MAQADKQKTCRLIAFTDVSQHQTLHSEGAHMTNKQKLTNAAAACLLALLATACSKTDNSDMNYKAAINDHYKANPECIWRQPKKLPAQAATSDDAKTEGYDALTQAGLLVRTTAEKKVFIVASKQVNNYD